LSARTETVGRSDGWTVRHLLVYAGIASLTVYPATRLTAQGVTREFSYDELRPTGLQFDVGVIGASRLRSAPVGGLRLEYGRIAPRVRVLLGLSYYRSEFSSDAIARFEERITELVNDPEGNATVDIGEVDWSDLTGDVDLQYILPQGRTVTAYIGLGLGVHLRNGTGAAISGTFLEDALDDVAIGLNGTLGAEFAVESRWHVALDARVALLSDHTTASLRGGLMYRFGKPRQP
jgi:hypothetical protein